MKMNFIYKVILLIGVGAILCPGIAEAQRWKRMRYEVNYGLGATNFLGELGGADQIGTNQFKDLEFSMTRFVLSGGMRYKMLKWLSAKGSIQLGMLRGDDALTQEDSRNYRNLNFRSPIYEFAVQIEASIIKEQSGARYRLRGVKGRKWLAVNTYPFIGIAGFYMNPKAQYKGVWYALQPLATEGQGQFSTRKKYSRFQLAIPMGIGFKYGFNRRWSVSLEYGIRKTFTDYIDDVSTTYVNADFIKAGAEGDKQVAVALADQADGGLGQNGSSPNKTAPGQQRGDPRDNDAYMFAIFSLNYKFRKLHKRRRSRPKF